MKISKIISVVALLTLGTATVSYASIDKNLKYGQKDLEVTELQEFLIDRGLLKTTPSNFFGLLTLKAVKAYQTSIGVSSTGFVGVLTREKINKEIDAEVASSNEAEINETGVSIAQNVNTSTTKDLCKNIEGMQSKVPDGMFMNNDGICFTPTIKQETQVQDVCKNIEGNQTTVPTGMLLDNTGNCTIPATTTYSPSTQNKPEIIKYLSVGTRDHQVFQIVSNKKIDFTRTKFIKGVYDLSGASGDCRMDLEKKIVCLNWKNNTEIIPVEILEIQDKTFCEQNICGNYTYFIKLSKKLDDFMDNGFVYRGTPYSEESLKILRYKLMVTDVDGYNVVTRGDGSIYWTQETGLRDLGTDMGPYNYPL